jgi:nitrogenase molybdenum-iron protein alpha chain
MTIKNISPSETFKEESMKAYPAKVGRKRAQQIVSNTVAPDGTVPVIQANSRTAPGIISQRGCTYAGCKGVVLGPTRDIVNLVHGPIGCSFYAWLTRRNQTRPPSPTDPNYMTYCFSTDLQDEHIIFGGEKKLKLAVQEAFDLFHPKAIGIFSTCPVGLIGDDVHAVAREMKEKLGINVFGFSCEGYKGVSQSAGHHIANNQLFRHVVGLDDTPAPKPFSVNLLGEYNIGGDGFVIEDLFAACGFHLQTTFSGNSTYEKFANSHVADLNVVTCHRSINYMADMMKRKYGIPWIKVNFVGAQATAKSLRRIAAYFKDPALSERTEKVIAEGLGYVEEALKVLKPRTEGKTAMLFVGGSRAHHYQELFKELGMTVAAAGYEFAHRDDYEGRRVLPSIQVDADSRNIEELHVEPDPERFKVRRTEAEIEALKPTVEEFEDYMGMMREMEEGSLVIDDINHWETEKLIETFRPDVFCAGIKEKYVVQKMGVPCKQLHSYDYGGPYTGFLGAVNFYKEIERMVNNKVWKRLTPPWKAKTGPQLTAVFARN